MACARADWQGSEKTLSKVVDGDLLHAVLL